MWAAFTQGSRDASSATGNNDLTYILNSTNGMVDNEDIYGQNGILDAGEDVQNTGVLVKDVTECSDPSVLTTTPSYGTDRVKRAIAVAAWTNGTGPNHNYFRNALRLFNGEDFQVSITAGKLSSTLGITVATENMVYIWGNYNTTGINVAPAAGTSSLNDASASSRYNGDQVPASIVSDAFLPRHWRFVRYLGLNYSSVRCRFRHSPFDILMEAQAS